MTRAALATSQRNVPINGTDGSVDAELLFRFNTTTGVTFTNSPTTSIETIDGESCVKVVTPVATQVEVKLASLGIAPPHYNMGVGFLIYCDHPHKIDELRILYGAAGYARFNQLALDIDLTGTARKVYARSNWHFYYHGPRIGATTFLPFSDTLDEAKLRVTGSTGNAITYYVHSAWLLRTRRPVWIIGFDDCRLSVVTGGGSITMDGVAGTYTGKDILDHYGYKGTLYCVGDPGDPTNTMAWSDIQGLAAAGWDIQAQCNWNPVSSDNQGSQLLGPLGYAAKSVASVANASNTITASVAHGINGSAYPYPVIFSGTDLPSPLAAGTTYYARETSTTAFTLHPTGADAIANSATIDLTTDGTAANFTFRYALAANDESAIYADYVAICDKVELEIGTRPIHLATNQGACDYYVALAAKQAGFKSVRLTQSGSISPTYLPSSVASFAEPVFFGETIQCEGATSQATIEAAVDAVIKRGTVGHSYTHYVTDQSAQCLEWLCNYLRAKQRQGMIEVMTITEWYDSLSDSIRVPTSRLSA